MTPTTAETMPLTIGDGCKRLKVVESNTVRISPTIRTPKMIEPRYVFVSRASANDQDEGQREQEALILQPPQCRESVVESNQIAERPQEYVEKSRAAPDHHHAQLAPRRRARRTVIDGHRDEGGQQVSRRQADYEIHRGAHK